MDVHPRVSRHFAYRTRLEDDRSHRGCLTTGDDAGHFAFVKPECIEYHEAIGDAAAFATDAQFDVGTPGRFEEEEIPEKLLVGFVGDLPDEYELPLRQQEIFRIVLFGRDIEGRQGFAHDRSLCTSLLRVRPNGKL